MTTKALEEVLEKFGRPLTDPHCATLVASARAELAALSSVPEDVARDYDAVRWATWPRKCADQCGICEPCAALSRLATAAARVPGLEAEVSNLYEQARMAAAERDAARQEVEECQRERTASDHARALWKKEHAALTARVAELEGDLRLIRERMATAEAANRGLSAAHEAAEARATAAEKRIRDAADRLTGILKGPDRKDPLELETCCDEVAHRLSAPTPAPGLREAVGPRITPVERLVDVARRLARGATTRAAWDDLDAALSAYEAAKGGEAPAPSEPVVTHAQLAAVVEAMISETTRVCGTQGYASTYISALHDVWRRVTGGEVPEVLAKARVVEVLAHLNDIVGSSIPEYDRGWRDCVASARSMLGLTLPTGPDAGEHTAETKCSRCGKRRYKHNLRTDEMTWHCAIAGSPLFVPENSAPRARIAPTPKTEEES